MFPETSRLSMDVQTRSLGRYPMRPLSLTSSLSRKGRKPSSSGSLPVSPLPRRSIDTTCPPPSHPTPVRAQTSPSDAPSPPSAQSFAPSHGPDFVVAS